MDYIRISAVNSLYVIPVVHTDVTSSSGTSAGGNSKVHKDTCCEFLKESLQLILK